MIIASLLIVLAIPTFFFDSTLGNFVTGGVVAEIEDVGDAVREYVLTFPLTVFSADGARVCIRVEDEFFEMVNQEGIFTVEPVIACEGGDFSLSFEDRNELTIEPTCTNFFAQEGFTYGPGDYYNEEFSCTNDFKETYCLAAELCAEESSPNAFFQSCCLEEDVVVQTNEPEDDVVGRASFSIVSGLSSVVGFVLIGLLFGVLLVGGVAYRSNSHVEKKRVEQLSRWVAASRRLGYKENQIRSVLGQKQFPSSEINKAVSSVFPKK